MKTPQCAGCYYLAAETSICSKCPHLLALASKHITRDIRLYRITPVSKPRQTRSDKWKQRKCVMKYRDFADKCRKLGIYINDSGDHITFIVPMPDTWSKSKKVNMNNKPHQQRPDSDNFLKAVQDAVMKEDASIWDIRITKRWGYIGAIEITSMEASPQAELRPVPSPTSSAAPAKIKKVK